MQLMRDLKKRPIQRARLMRICPITQRLLAPEREAECFPERRRLALLTMRAEIVGYRRVVGRNSCERLAREMPSEWRSHRALVRIELRADRFIVRRIDDHRDVAIIFRRGPDQRRSPDIDIFDGIVELYARLRNRLLEWIKIHDHEIDRFDSMLKHLPLMALLAAPRENPSVDFRMQRLHPSAQHLRRTGKALDRS